MALVVGRRAAFYISNHIRCWHQCLRTSACWG